MPGTAPRHLAVAPLKSKPKEDTIYTISMRSNSAESLEKKGATSPTARSEPIVSDVKLQTQNITALAAKKKRVQQQVMSSRLNLQDRQFHGTFHSDDDAGNTLTTSRLDSHNYQYDSKFNFGDDFDSYDPFIGGRDVDDASPAKVSTKLSMRGPQHRHQALLRVQHQTHNAPLANSNSDKLSDITADTPIKVGYVLTCVPFNSRLLCIVLYYFDFLFERFIVLL